MLNDHPQPHKPWQCNVDLLHMRHETLIHTFTYTIPADYHQHFAQFTSCCVLTNSIILQSMILSIRWNFIDCLNVSLIWLYSSCILSIFRLKIIITCISYFTKLFPEFHLIHSVFAQEGQCNSIHKKSLKWSALKVYNVSSSSIMMYWMLGFGWSSASMNCVVLVGSRCQYENFEKLYKMKGKSC